jgi:DNA polymerase
MTTEQLNLFGDVDEPKKPVEVPRPPSVKKRGGAFLPGVVPEDAYPGIDNYETLLTELKNCSRCSLRSGCRQVVPGDGKIASRILFIGEGPGADEDEQGIPFVGRAGKLLNQILKAAEFDRNEVFIGNVVKCRPPGNRCPTRMRLKSAVSGWRRRYV